MGFVGIVDSLCDTLTILPYGWSLQCLFPSDTESLHPNQTHVGTTAQPATTLRHHGTNNTTNANCCLDSTKFSLYLPVLKRGFTRRWIRAGSVAYARECVHRLLDRCTEKHVMGNTTDGWTQSLWQQHQPSVGRSI